MVETRPEKRLEALQDRRRNIRMEPSDIMHSTLVAKLRWFLPIVALSILAVLLIWPKVEIELASRRFAPSKMDKAALEQAATQNKLLNANFSALDSKGRPFNITATQAVQQKDNPDMIDLQSPEGTLKLNETDNVTAKSLSGTYAQAKQILTLVNDVVLTKSDGTIANTQELQVDLINNNSHTDKPVEINGPQGHLNAQGMDVKEGGNVTIFKGPAKLILNNTKAAKTGEKL